MTDRRAQPPGVEEIVAEIRREIARQKANGASVAGEVVSRPGAPVPPPLLIGPPAIALPHFTMEAAAPRLPRQSVYQLQDLLDFEDRAFIENAFQVILDRAPDGEGGVYFLQSLRAGKLTKLDILGALSGSPEARRDVTIEGLGKTLARRRWLQVPVLGRLLAIFTAIWRLPGMMQEVQKTATLQARWSREMGEHLETFSAQTEETLIQQTQHAATQLRAQAHYLQRHKAGVRTVGRIMDELAGVQSRLEELERELREKSGK